MCGIGDKDIESSMERFYISPYPNERDHSNIKNDAEILIICSVYDMIFIKIYENR